MKSQDYEHALYRTLTKFSMTHEVFDEDAVDLLDHFNFTLNKEENILSYNKELARQSKLYA